MAQALTKIHFTGMCAMAKSARNWQQTIFLQVIQHMATEAEKQARDEQLEAILGLKMMHPNIVRTFQFATKDRTVCWHACPGCKKHWQFHVIWCSHQSYADSRKIIKLHPNRLWQSKYLDQPFLDQESTCSSRNLISKLF